MYIYIYIYMYIYTQPLFIIVMTVMMRDINSNLTQEERFILRNEQPIVMEGHDKLLYADDTIILTRLRKSYFIEYKRSQVGTT